MQFHAPTVCTLVDVDLFWRHDFADHFPLTGLTNEVQLTAVFLQEPVVFDHLVDHEAEERRAENRQHGDEFTGTQVRLPSVQGTSNGTSRCGPSPCRANPSDGG